MTASRRNFLLCWLTGVLLAVSYPRASLGYLAWIALVPMLAGLLRASSRKEAMVLAASGASVFFLVSLSWLRFVTFFGWLFVAALEASFFLILGFLWQECLKFRLLPARVFGVALSWMMVEMLRSEIPILGLGWNQLAFSQTDFLPLVQFANLGGSYGLGFMMALVNALFFEAFHVIKERDSSLGFPIFDKIGKAALPALAAGLLIGGLWAYGTTQLKPEEEKTADSIRISLLQGNIPQSLKWEAEARDKIIQIYFKMTELASYDEPHLIVWPEASFPGFFNLDGQAAQLETLVRTLQTPVVVGAPYFESQVRVFNSAFLLGADGELKGRYDKVKLVPFGEYVPFGFLLSWLEPVAEALGVSDFTAGKELTVFELEKPRIPFSVLICFEDVFPRLARRFAEKGARFLAVITNDAWFGRSGAPYQHLQASIFRALETGLPVVRAANTGVSAVVSSRGEVLGRVEKDGKDIFKTGFKTLSVPLDDHVTVYRKGGWIVPYALALLGTAFFLFRWLQESRKAD